MRERKRRLESEKWQQNCRQWNFMTIIIINDTKDEDKISAQPLSLFTSHSPSALSFSLFLFSSFSHSGYFIHPTLVALSFFLPLEIFPLLSSTYGSLAISTEKAGWVIRSERGETESKRRFCIHTDNDIRVILNINRDLKELNANEVLNEKHQGPIWLGWEEEKYREIWEEMREGEKGRWRSFA